MTDAALLRIENLSVAYGATCAVDAVSLELHPGRCLGVIGESGAGRAGRAMMGLLPHRLASAATRISRGSIYWATPPEPCAVSESR